MTDADLTIPPRPEDESARMQAVEGIRFLRNTRDGALIALVTLAQKLLGMPLAAVTVLDGDREWMITQQGLDADEFPRDEALCAHAILEPDRPMVIPDIEDDPILGAHPAVQAGIRFYAGIPIHAAGDQPVGALCVMDRSPRTLSPEQEEMLGLIAVAIEGAVRRMTLLQNR